MKKNIEFNSLLFRHKNEMVDWAKLVTGTCLKCSEILFSGKRPERAKKEVKLSGAARVLDYLYREGTACLFLGEESGYCEFSLGKERYHALVDSERIRFSEDDVPARWHMLLPILAQRIVTEKKLGVQGVGNALTFVRETKGTEEDILAGGLFFVDEFYYGNTQPVYEVAFGCEEVIEEAKAGFRSGLFSKENKTGNLDTDLETEKPVGAETKKTRTKKAKSPKKETNAEVFERMKRGDFIVDYGWAPEQEPFITPLSFLKGYVPDENFFAVFHQVNKRVKMAIDRMAETDEKVMASKKDAVNIFLAGKPGTGKTYMLFALSAALGFPIRSIPMSKNTEEDTFEGMSKVIEGSLTEVRTPFLINGEKGGISIIEEINLANPDVVMGAIGQFVEFPYSIMEQGYKQVRRHPLNIIVGTMNIGTAGSKEVSEALSSRFPQTYILNDPEEKDFLARLEIEGHEPKACKWVYSRYTDIINALRSPDYNCEEILNNVTFRSCLGALSLMEYGSDAKTAIRNTMIGKVAEKDMEVAERLWNMIKERPDYVA